MSFYDTTEVIRALEKWLASLMITNPNAPDHEEPLFEVVTKLDTPDIMLAAEKTFAVTERLCCVVPGNDSYGVIKDRPLTLQRVQDFMLVMSATDFSPFSNENVFGYGDGDTSDTLVQTGLIWMKDELIKKIFGQPLSNLVIKNDLGEVEFEASFNCTFQPTGAELAAFKNDKYEQEVREGIILALKVSMGEQTACQLRGTRRASR